MILDPPLRPGDIVQLKKKHPCGSDQWQVLLAGSDVRLKCLGCGRVILLDRVSFNSKIKKRISIAQKADGNI